MPENKPIQIAEKILYAVEYGFIVKLIKTTARIKLPWLNKPLIGKIFDIIVDKIAAGLYKELSRFIAFKIIDIQVSNQIKGYEVAREEFKAAIATGDQDEIAKKKAAFEAAFARGINFNGV